ncbi:MAG: transcriptional repressor [Bacteroidales bacterium]
MNASDLAKMLTEKSLKVTPQRMAVLKAILRLGNHPSADEIMESIRKELPNTSLATIYKVLEVLVEVGLIRKVKTDKDIMRYDAILQKHHHIYYSDSGRIEDYFDQELSELLENYFSTKEIPGLDIKEINVHIIAQNQI